MSRRARIPGEPAIYDLCPCGSGQKSKFCCRTLNGWFRKPHVFGCYQARTGVSRTDCVASVLGDCQGPLSREHVIPHAILDAGSISPTVTIDGLYFQQNGAKPIGKGSATARVTCVRHNNIASPLDSALARLLICIHNFYRDVLKDCASSQMYLFSGPDIERALLKFLLVSIAGKWIRDGTKPAELSALPETMAAAVWGDLAFDGGLYAIDTQDSRSWDHRWRAFTWTGPWKAGDAIVGCEFWLAGMPLAITLVALSQCGNETAPYRKAYRRPPRLVVRHANAELSILLSWPPGWETDGKEICRDSVFKDDIQIPDETGARK
jgi:hypothetical protein